MRQHVRMNGRALAVLLVPVLLAAGAVQPAEAPPVPADTGQRRLVADAAPAVRVPAPQPQAAPARVALRAGPAPVRQDADRASRRRDPVSPAAARTPEQRGRAALGALRYDWRALGYRVVFRPYRGGTLGTANRRTRVVTVFVSRTQSEQSLRATIAHELAHALDFEHGTRERRDAYRQLRGLTRTGPWFPCSRCDDLSSPAGDFAEVFALWLAGPGDFRSRLKAAPDADALADLVPLFRIPTRVPRAPMPSPSASPSPRTTEDAGPLPPVLGPPPSPRVREPV